MIMIEIEKGSWGLKMRYCYCYWGKNIIKYDDKSYAIEMKYKMCILAW